LSKSLKYADTEENQWVSETKVLRKSKLGRGTRTERGASTAYGNKQCLKNKLELVNRSFSLGMDVCIIKTSTSISPYAG
jgi:hypothetical protein